jgi:hypothetical protein
MFKKYRFKFLFFAVLLSLPLIFGVILDGFAFSPEPPSGGKISGKGMSGVLTVVLTTDICGDTVCTAIILAADSNGTPFSIGPDQSLIDPNSLPSATAEDILDWYLPEAGPGGEDLVIDKVTGFYNTGTAIGAEVLLQVLQY